MPKKQTPKVGVQPRALSRCKLRAFKLISLAIPLIVFALAEGALRICGFGGYFPMLQRVGSLQGGTLVIAPQGGAASWFFANPDRAGENELHAFLDPKPTNTVRVFCVGESAMQGYPQPRHLASSSFLQAMLQDVWPERKVEVINLGTTAVASFPVLGIMTEALEFQPDLMVIYTGNNEFFGTYGIASTGRAGSKPWMLRASRALHSLALVQAIDRWTRPERGDFQGTLMETMMAQNYVGPDDWRRAAAANNLYHHVVEMVRRCQARGVPVLVCDLPSNERDMAPIGVDRLDSFPVNVQHELTSLLATVETKLREHDVESAVAALQRILSVHPRHARAHFLLGRCLSSQGKSQEALRHFVAARDADSMPWRPPSASADAVRRATRDQSVPVCNLEQAFRDASPGGAIGWELMDDHVHPTLRGQALIAECVLNSLMSFQGDLHVSALARSNLPPWTDYARRLGENEFDRFGVAHKMRLLFNAQFMRANNPHAFERHNAMATAIEAKLPANVRTVLSEWQESRPFAGARCPVTAAVAQLELKQDEYQSALDHYQIARRAVPEYTSWFLEYTYYALYCKQKLNGTLSVEERRQALDAIEQGRFLIQYLPTETGFAERYTGLLHLLRRDYAKAVPFLLASRRKLVGFDRVVVDQTLILSYVKIGQYESARALAAQGVSTGGEHAARYQQLLNQLPTLMKAAAEEPDASKGAVN